jgi:hypothetical protein
MLTDDQKERLENHGGGDAPAPNMYGESPCVKFAEAWFANKHLREQIARWPFMMINSRR